jgi:hypothetical protein
MMKGDMEKAAEQKTGQVLARPKTKAGPPSRFPGPIPEGRKLSPAIRKDKLVKDKPVKEGRSRVGRNKDEAARAKIRGDIEGLLDVLTVDGLSHVLAVATMCRYELALVRSQEARVEDEGLPLAIEGGALRIERSADGSTYHLISGKIWKILAAEDIAALLRISRHEDSPKAAAHRLYHWMKNERRDLAADFRIRSDRSPVLGELLSLLAETFPVRSPRRLP